MNKIFIEMCLICFFQIVVRVSLYNVYKIPIPFEYLYENS